MTTKNMQEVIEGGIEFDYDVTDPKIPGRESQVRAWGGVQPGDVFVVNGAWWPVFAFADADLDLVSAADGGNLPGLESRHIYKVGKMKVTPEVERPSDFPGARAAIRATKAKAEHLTPQEPTELHSVVTIEAPDGERLTAFRFSTDVPHPWVVLNQIAEVTGVCRGPSRWEQLCEMGAVTLPDKPGVTIPEGRIPGIDHPITDGLIDASGDEWAYVDGRWGWYYGGEVFIRHAHETLAEALSSIVTLDCVAYTPEQIDKHNATF